jgi:hypothetical protein
MPKKHKLGRHRALCGSGVVDGQKISAKNVSPLVAQRPLISESGGGDQEVGGADLLPFYRLDRMHVNVRFGASQKLLGSMNLSLMRVLELK